MSNPNPLCECPLSGTCHRHGVKKTRREWELCAGLNCTLEQNRRYWDAWEHGRMLGQERGAADPSPLPLPDATAGRIRARGLGDRISSGIQHATFGLVRPCGGCKQRAATLNHWFPAPLPPLDRTPYGGPVIRHLLYHVLPLRGGPWRRNLERLSAGLDSINGRRIVAIVRDQNGDTPEAVQEHLAGHGIEWIVVPNNKKLREVATFIPLLERLAPSEGQDAPANEITFYGHCKGVTHGDPTNSATTVHRWADAMYETVYYNWREAQRLLETYAMAGAFKRYGQFTTRGNHRWHYSGTFYWFRNLHVYRRNWRYVDQKFFGTESWPGLMFRPEETACLFCDNAGDLYKMSYWKDHVEPELQKWSAQQKGALV